MATDLQNLVIKIEADAKNALKELEITNKSLRSLQKEVKKSSSEQAKLTKSFQSANEASHKFNSTLKTLAATFLTLQGSKEFVGLLGDVESGFIGVAKTTGLASKDFEELKKKIFDLSTSMSGVSTF